MITAPYRNDHADRDASARINGQDTDQHLPDEELLTPLREDM